MEELLRVVGGCGEAGVGYGEDLARWGHAGVEPEVHRDGCWALWFEMPGFWEDAPAARGKDVHWPAVVGVAENEASLSADEEAVIGAVAVAAAQGALGVPAMGAAPAC